MVCNCFFFNDTATTEIYTLSLHDALPISWIPSRESSLARAQKKSPDGAGLDVMVVVVRSGCRLGVGGAGIGVKIDRGKKDRKSTRLNSSHANISYAVFCLKKKKSFITSSS